MIGFAREEMSRSGILMRKFSPGQVKREDWLIPAEEMAGGIIELIKPGEIVLITGASGSGKSMLMREIGKQLGARASATVDLELPDRLVIDAMRWLEL